MARSYGSASWGTSRVARTRRRLRAPRALCKASARQQCPRSCVRSSFGIGDNTPPHNAFGVRIMEYDVIIVGGGNAACAAAVSARENGAKRVALLEKAPRNQRGGNTHFSGAILRFVFNNVSELDRFVPGAEEEYPGFHAGVPVYPKEAFKEDLMRVTEGRTDPELSELLIDESYGTTCWMQDVGKHKF